MNIYSKASYLASLAAVCLALSACVGNSKITKRYSYLENPPSSTSSVRVNAFEVTNPSPSRTNRTLADLDGEAQAAAIKALSGDKKLSQEDIISLLSQPISPKLTPATKTDFTVFSKRIGVTVDYNGKPAPGDRIDNMTTTFTLSGNGAKFEQWSRLANVHRVVDLGDLTFKDTAESSINTVISGLTLNSKFSNELTEEFRLRNQLLEIYGFLNGSEANLVQRGAYDRDLVGIQTVDFTIRLERRTKPQTIVYKFEEGDAGKLAKLSFRDIIVPKSADKVDLQVSVDGQIREIRRGRNTVTESDDRIRLNDFGTKTTPSSVELFKASEVNIKCWTLQDNKNLRIQSKEKNGVIKTIIFTDYDEAWKFINWARNQKGVIKLDEDIELRKISTPGTNDVDGNYFKGVFTSVGKLNNNTSANDCSP